MNLISVHALRGIIRKNKISNEPLVTTSLTEVTFMNNMYDYMGSDFSHSDNLFVSMHKVYNNGP
jgi:hypothetical protein